MALPDTGAVANLRRLFTAGACAASARPAFPAVTAPGHASLWTGTTARGHGVVGSWGLLAPEAGHSLLEQADGFGFSQLDAEPLWIAAMRQGRRVVAHQVTHAPNPPGYPLRRRTAEGSTLLRDATTTLDGPLGAVVNGYNRQVAPARVLTDSTLALDAPAWRGLAPGTVARAGTIPVGSATLHILVARAGATTRWWVAPRPEFASAVEVVPHAADRSDARTRPLARWFAPAVPLVSGHDRVTVRVRLFDASPDGSRFTLFVSEARRLDANTDAVRGAYVAAAPSWVGNSALGAWKAGAFGPTFAGGTMGEAEWRALESAELLVVGFLEGFRWGWARGPDLMIDYLPLLDDTDHELLGFVAYGRAGVDPAAIQAFRARLWALADRWLGAHMDVAGPGTLLVVSGDHGMRPTRGALHPNVILERAGLLVRDGEGKVDLARSRAYSPTGYWVNVNTTARPLGLVPPDERGAVMDAAERALLAARDEAGNPVVVRTWRADAPGADTLAIGGPHGGDVYYDVAPGLDWTSALGDRVVVPHAPEGDHGFPSVAPDMHTVLCGWGGGLGAVRTGPARIIDAAPTVADWLGIAPPRHATGRSVLGEWRR